MRRGGALGDLSNKQARIKERQNTHTHTHTHTYKEKERERESKIGTETNHIAMFY